MITPLGGVCFLAGWLCLALAAWRAAAAGRLRRLAGALVIPWIGARMPAFPEFASGYPCTFS